MVEKEIATYSIILALKIPWTGERGGLLEFVRVGYDSVTKLQPPPPKHGTKISTIGFHSVLMSLFSL